MYYKYFGGEDIHFTPDERRKIKNADLTPGIEVLAFKPVYCDPIYHCKNTYFVTYSKDANEGKILPFLFVMHIRYKFCICLLQTLKISSRRSLVDAQQKK